MFRMDRKITDNIREIFHKNGYRTKENLRFYKEQKQNLV